MAGRAREVAVTHGARRVLLPQHGRLPTTEMKELLKLKGTFLLLWPFPKTFLNLHTSHGPVNLISYYILLGTAP